MSLKNYGARTKLLDKGGWRLIGWDADDNEKDRKHVTVVCARDPLSYKKLPYHGSLALWSSLLNHRGCRHGRAAPNPPSLCPTCGKPGYVATPPP